nr:VOC family protein [Streptomyces sp. LX-29]
MNITTSTVCLTVDDVAASRDFFITHFGYAEAMAADGFVSLTHPDGGVSLAIHRRGLPVLPDDLREQTSRGIIVAFTVTGLEAHQDRLRAAGVPITLPLREEPWGERLFMVADPNGVPVELVEWATPPAGDA